MLSFLAVVNNCASTLSEAWNLSKYEPTKTTCQYLPSLVESAAPLWVPLVYIGSLPGGSEVPGAKTSTPCKGLSSQKVGFFESVFWSAISKNRFSG